MPSATARAARSATSRGAPSSIQSISPASSASFALACRADRMRSSARATPASRGIRCVPPAPGMMPSVTSGRPIRALGRATRAWAAIATSSPPPSAVPWIVQATGTGLFSMASHTPGSHGSAGGRPNSRMSAPAMKVRPSP